MGKLQDLQENFVEQMLNDNVGIICNAHVVHADRSSLGARDPKCLELAKQASVAFDFPKTGIPGVMPPDLKVSEYPDFMEKDEGKTYTSKKVLGELYRRVKGKVTSEEAANVASIGAQKKEPRGVTNEWLLASKTIASSFDSDLIVAGYEQHLEQAFKIKREYTTAIRLLMYQYGITTEGELVTGQIIHMSRFYQKNQGSSKEKVNLAYSIIRREYRHAFLVQSGCIASNYKDDEHENNENNENNKETSFDQRSSKWWTFGKFTTMMKVVASAWYYVTYHPDWLGKENEIENEDEDDKGGAGISLNGLHSGLLISFPWLVVDVLANMKSSSKKN